MRPEVIINLDSHNKNINYNNDESLILVIPKLEL